MKFVLVFLLFWTIHVSHPYHAIDHLASRQKSRGSDSWTNPRTSQPDLHVLKPYKRLSITRVNGTTLGLSPAAATNNRVWRRKELRHSMETQRIVLTAGLNQSRAYLISISRPASTGTEIGDFLTIGRDPECQMRLEDGFVSGRHARIEKKTGGFVLRDLQSRNGTYLNGARINEAILSPHDRIRFGESVFVFSLVNTTELANLNSKNPSWNSQLQRIPSFAACGFPVLITGPSGSGKEILARALHDRSPRAQAEFVGINCSALHESLIESELFGHVKGSYTGAAADRKGAFESARGGTIFLDEIGDLPLSLQPKLLRALENNEIRPLGSDRVVSTDVRIIAATHKNLADQVRLGRFREDLFYRLNVCNLHPPRLVERMEDFEDLLYSFAKQYRVRFSFGAIARLKEHSWPGNVRELKNLVARTSAYYPGKHIQPEDLESIIETTKTSVLEEALRATDANGMSGGSIIKEFEREIIIRRLIANQGNQRRTAIELGIPKSTLHDRLKSYSINLDDIVKRNESPIP